MRRLFLAMAAAGVLAGCAPAAPPAPKTAQIVIDSLAYGAAPADLRVGDTLQWANHDMFEHTATAKDGQFDVDLPAGATRGVVLRKAGIITYICRFHPGMTGQITVSE